MPVNLRSFAVGALSLLLFTGCGPEPTLEVGAQDVTRLVPGASTTLDVSVIRNASAKGDWTLSVAGLPTGVTATFEPAVVGKGVDEAALTLTATRDAARGMALLTVTATGTGKDPLVASTTLALEVRGLTVQGRVEAAMWHVGLPDFLVQIEGTLARTDSEGRFTIKDVALPYDLAIGHVGALESYPGLTSAEPVVRSAFGLDVAPRHASVVVTLSAPVPAGQSVWICASGVDGIAKGCEVAVEDETTVQVPVDWAASTTREVKLQAYGATLDGSGSVTAFTSASQSAALTLAQNDVKALTLTMGAAPATSPLATTIDTPAWAQSSGWLTVVPLAEGGLMNLGEPNPTGTSSMEGVPRIAQAQGTEGIGLSWRPAGDVSTTMGFPSLPTILTQVEGGTIPAEIVLSAPAAGELTTIGLEFENGQMLIHTTSDRVRIPDVSAFWGAAPLEFESVSLLVRGSNFDSMDDALGRTSPLETLIGLLNQQGLPETTSAGGVTMKQLLF